MGAECGVGGWFCSNLAWSAEEDDAALDWLQQHGLNGIEVAPARLWPQ